MPTPEQIAALLSLGVPGLLVVAVLALVREWVVPGATYRRALAERDEAFGRLERVVTLLEGVQRAPQ